MAGLGLLFGLGIAAIGKIAYGISDMQYRSTPTGTTQNGEPYYMGRDAKCYAANGERMILQTAVDARGNRYNRTVGERTGKVYFDREKTLQDKADKDNEESRKSAIENGYLAYAYRDRTLPFFNQERVTKELSTGKYIARLEYNPYKKEFRKYYLAPNACFPFLTVDGDKGILITKEEFEKLNCYGGHHVYGKEEFLMDRNNKVI